jgi:hypothetical protein
MPIDAVFKHHAGHCRESLTTHLLDLRFRFPVGSLIRRLGPESWR